ncbi:hypothetical protein CVT91_01210 [Candidatus Atribacteria bacterium HGW-Atribacteria-1]|nr:MAG: hypothetical protein CVT91_01210 [Candidatus Atribacteria bacterium HGW-Atribacteria-1]
MFILILITVINFVKIIVWTTSYKMLEDDLVITDGDNVCKNGIFEKILTKNEVTKLTINYKNK